MKIIMDNSTKEKAGMTLKETHRLKFQPKLVKIRS